MNIQWKDDWTPFSSKTNYTILIHNCIKLHKRISASESWKTHLQVHSQTQLHNKIHTFTVSITLRDELHTVIITITVLDKIQSHTHYRYLLKLYFMQKTFSVISGVSYNKKEMPTSIMIYNLKSLVS